MDMDFAICCGTYFKFCLRASNAKRIEKPWTYLIVLLNWSLHYLILYALQVLGLQKISTSTWRLGGSDKGFYGSVTSPKWFQEQQCVAVNYLSWPMPSSTPLSHMPFRCGTTQPWTSQQTPLDQPPHLFYTTGSLPIHVVPPRPVQGWADVLTASIRLSLMRSPSHTINLRDDRVLPEICKGIQLIQITL